MQIIQNYMASSIPIEYESFLNWSILPIDVTLTGTTTRGWSGPRSNCNEGVLHTPQISRTKASPECNLLSWAFWKEVVLQIIIFIRSE